MLFADLDLTEASTAGAVFTDCTTYEQALVIAVALGPDVRPE